MKYQYYKMTPNLNFKSEHVAIKEAFLGFNLAMLTREEFEILSQILTQNSKVPSCLPTEVEIPLIKPAKLGLY